MKIETYYVLKDGNIVCGRPLKSENAAYDRLMFIKTHMSDILEIVWEPTTDDYYEHGITKDGKSVYFEIVKVISNK